MISLMGAVTFINACYVSALGMAGVASSQLVAGELARVVFGGHGQTIINIALVASTVFVLRARRTGESEGCYRAPLFPLLPALVILTLLMITVHVVLSQPGSVWVGLLFLAGGYPLFLLLRRYSRMKS